MSQPPKHPVYLLFGDHSACRLYVASHDLTPSRWRNVWEPEHLRGVDPTSGNYIAKKLLGFNPNAVQYWRSRGGTFT